MIHILLVSLGIIFLIWSLNLSLKITKKENQKKHNINWKILSGLIFLFIIGYLFDILYLIFIQKTNFRDMLISLVFFAGSIFVSLVINLSYDYIIELKKDKQRIHTQIVELQIISKGIKDKQLELEKTKQKLEIKNKELEDTLEEFYTYRLDIHNKENIKKFEIDNKKLKSKINSLKKSKK